MNNRIIVAKVISQSLKANHLNLLTENNLHRIFEPIYYLGLRNEVTNTLICAIIYSYDNESKWIDLKQDGLTINKNILEGLYADLSETTYKEFLYLTNEDINECVGKYLDLLPDWKFRHARKLMDFHSYVLNKKIEDVNSKDIREAKAQREDAEELIKLIEKEYVATNHRLQTDFGVSYVDKTLEFYQEESEKIDIMKWEHFIKYEKPKLIAKG